MRFESTAIPGLFVVAPELLHDDRGFFTRLYSPDEFEAHGLNATVAQTSLSFNRRRGTVRGMHYQRPPAAEAKLVRCGRGAIFDVAVDLRPDSPAYLRWVACELTADNRKAVYIPEGCAHGFQTLEDDCDVFYHVSHPYAPELASGFRYDDSAIGVDWPLAVTVISPRDLAWPPLEVSTGESRT